MKKITELTEPQYKTVHYKDEFGNRQRTTQEFQGIREVRTVSSGKRFGHYIVDSIVFGIISIPLRGAYEGVLEDSNMSPALTILVALSGFFSILLLSPFLYTVCEAIWQKTPGKFITKTIVIDEYGNKPEMKNLILRSLSRLVPFEAFSCLGDPSYGWHDKWTKTWVVTEDELAELKRLQLEQHEGWKPEDPPVTENEKAPKEGGF